MPFTTHVTLASNSPAADRALLTQAELEQAADGFDGDADSPSGSLAALGLEAAEWIATECGIAGIDGNPPTLRQEDLIETFRIVGTAPKALLLARGFVSDVSVTEEGTALTEDTDFVVSGDAGIVRRISSDEVIAWKAGKIVVSYTAGFATVPPVLKSVATDYIRVKLAQRERDPMMRSETAEGLGTISYRDGGDTESNFAATVADRLRRYRRDLGIW